MPLHARDLVEFCHTLQTGLSKGKKDKLTSRLTAGQYIRKTDERFHVDGQSEDNRKISVDGLTLSS